MRIPSWVHRPQNRGDQAMTSMIDCVFLLLIFFVCASVGQIRESMLGADLPSGGVSANVAPPEEKPLEDVWVKLKHVDGATIAEVNSRNYADLAALEEVLRELAGVAPEMPVILEVAPEVPLGDLIRIYDTCRAARFESIRFAADKKKLQR